MSPTLAAGGTLGGLLGKTSLGDEIGSFVPWLLEKKRNSLFFKTCSDFISSGKNIQMLGECC